MKIEEIVYDTTRELINFEDKLRIATLFLFCEEQGVVRLAELLYTDNHEKFIENLMDEHSSYDIDLRLDFANKNIKNAFELTLKSVREKIDDDRFLKAIYDGDEFALAICDILNFDFSAKVNEKLN